MRDSVNIIGNKYNNQITASLILVRTHYKPDISLEWNYI